MPEWKKIVFYAIIPAIIAGVFAVAPKLFDEFTEPKSILAYQITKGPILSEGGIQKAIYAINIRNDGEKPLTSILALLNTKNDIEAITTYENTGLNPKINKDIKPYTISVDTLHPGESFSISLMLIATNNQPTINLVLRSKEVLGIVEKSTKSEGKTSLDFISAVAAGASVFIMALFFISRNKNHDIYPLISEKPHILFYIAARLGLTDIVDKYGIKTGDITFIRFGDLLLAKGMVCDHEEKAKVLLALKSLLLINQIASESREQIVRNIKILDDNNYSQKEIDLIKSNAKAISKSNHPELRDLIDDYINNPAMFQNNT